MVRVPFDPLDTGCGLDATQAEQAATGLWTPHRGRSPQPKHVLMSYLFFAVQSEGA